MRNKLDPNEMLYYLGRGGIPGNPDPGNPGICQFSKIPFPGEDIFEIPGKMGKKYLNLAVQNVLFSSFLKVRRLI